MRSGTSFFDWTVFKKTVFRFWPLWAVYLVGWLFAMPLSGLTLLHMDADSYSFLAGGYVNNGYMKDFALYTVPNMADAALSVGLIFGVLTAMAVFSHLYNARSANLFGSLPIRREGLFLTHYLAGLAFFLVPDVLIFLLTLAVEAAGGYVCMEGLLFWLAAVCGEGFFFYSLAVFCAMFTGHILALPAFYAIINGLVMGITGLVHVVLQAFYYGFAGFPDGVYTVIRWFTPVVRLEGSLDWTVAYVPREGTESLDGIYVKEALKIRGLDVVGIYALVAVVLAVCAFLLYRTRRLESAGDVVAVKPMRPVFKYGVAFCAGLALGLGTAAILGGGNVTLMVTIVVWGVVGYFAAEMLLQKSFKVFQKWKGAVAVTAVFVVLFCVVGFDLTGFETRIPDPAGVESVTVSGLDIQNLGDDGDVFDLDITDPEIIRLITLIHKAAVEQRGVDRNVWRSDRTYTNLRVTYHLKNGGTLSREYYNIWVRPDEVSQEGTAAWALQQLYQNKELCWRMYGFDKLEDYLARGGRLDQAQHVIYDDYYGDQVKDVYYGGDAEALLAAVKEDFFAGRIGTRRVVEDKWGIYDRNDREFLSFISDKQSNDRYDYKQYIQIALSDTAASTRAALEELVPAAKSDWPDTEDIPVD